MEVEQLHSTQEDLMVVGLPEEPAILLPQCGTSQEPDDLQLIGSLQVASASKEPVEEAGLLPPPPPPPQTEAGESSGGGGKRKRCRPSQGVRLKMPSKKKGEEEDVCFICFDGGNLVLCDRRSCPKAYHPKCANVDEASLQGKTAWNCDWHICSICEKASHYMCYTCTYSLCNGCIKIAGLFCVRENKGFCETCMETVMQIEKGVQGDKEMVKVDFNDKNNWEYLFKEYWLDLKGKLSLTLEELTKARDPSKGSSVLAINEQPSHKPYDANDDLGNGSDSSTENVQASSSKGKTVEKQSRTSAGKGGLCSSKAVRGDGTSVMKDEWASKELLEFVAHVKDGDTSALSLKDVRNLLLDYIKSNNLRDRKKKRQILCDSVLGNLFRKERIEHFEMLRLLKQHFLAKGTKVRSETLEGSFSADATQMETEANRGGSTLRKRASDKRRKLSKRIDERGPQVNLDDFAAIDVHNINLIYLRRKLLEDMLSDHDMDKFEGKVVGSFVRIRVSGTVQNKDIYRLARVVGAVKTEDAYKTGRKMEDVTLEILNGSGTEVISIGAVSNQEFTEEECKHLRQSIKSGLISPLKVGEVQEKARALQKVRMKDWLETEKMRLSNLRDQASEKGRRKELNECLKKLRLLSTPEERSRLLEEIPKVHDDPNMDPSYASDEDDDGNYKRQRNYKFSRKGKEPISPSKGGSTSNIDWTSGGHKSTMDDLLGGGTRDSSWNPGSSSWETTPCLESGGWTSQLARSGVSSNAFPDIGPEPMSTELSSEINETEKIWHYQDPSGKIQGPFSMIQLRKWNKIGYFPSSLTIWRTSEKQEDAILLTDALSGVLQKEPSQWETQASGFSQLCSGTSAFDGRENNQEGFWSGSNGSTWRDKEKNDGDWESNWNNASGTNNGNTEESKKTDAWGTQASVWTSKASEGGSSKDEQTGISSGAWEPSKPLASADKWSSGQNDSWNRNTSGFGNSNQGLEKLDTSKDWETLSTVAPKLTTDGWDAKQVTENDLSNLDTAGQSAENKWSTASVRSMGSGWGPISNSGNEETKESPIVMADSDKISSGWCAQVCKLEKPTVGGWEVSSASTCKADEQNTASVKGWGSDALNPTLKANETTDVCDSPQIRQSNLVMHRSVSMPESLEPTVKASGQSLCLVPEDQNVEQRSEPDLSNSLTSQSVDEMPTDLHLAPANPVSADSLGSDPSATAMKLAEPLHSNLYNSEYDQASALTGTISSLDGCGQMQESNVDHKAADGSSQESDPSFTTLVLQPGEEIAPSFSVLEAVSNLKGKTYMKSRNWSSLSASPPTMPSGWGDQSANAADGKDSSNSVTLSNNLNLGLSSNTWETLSTVKRSVARDTSWGTGAGAENPDTRCSMTSKKSNEGWDTAKEKSSNMGLETALKGGTGAGWGTVNRGNAEAGWGVATQGKTNTKWEKVAVQGDTNAGWGWGTSQGSANAACGASQTGANAGWGTTSQVSEKAGWEAASRNSDSWGGQDKSTGETQGKTNTKWEKDAVHGNTDSGWGGLEGGTNAAWGPPKTSTNGGWGTTSQGSGKADWEAPSGNSNRWGDQDRGTGERFSGDRDRGFHASDSAQRSGKPSWNRSFSGDKDRGFHNSDSAQGGGKSSWNRSMSSGDGGSSRPPPKGQRVCKFHASGHCKKGASCDYLHT